MLRWEPSVLEDPEGGRIVLWPHLPCVRMPPSLRSRGRWGGRALLFSLSDLSGWRLDEKQDKESPGVHIEAAIASGTVLGRLMKDLQEYDVDGNGVIDQEEMTKLLQAIYDILGAGVTKPTDSAEERAKNIFCRMDENGDGLLTEEEFLSGCLQDDELAKMLAPNL